MSFSGRYLAVLAAAAAAFAAFLALHSGALRSGAAHHAAGRGVTVTADSGDGVIWE